MRIAKVPVDMASEQKELLGIASKRQVIYVAVGGSLVYSYVPVIFQFLLPFNWVLAAIVSVVLALPVGALVIFFGFTKIDKLNMNRDFYYIIKFTKHNQLGNWRKGR